LRESAGVTAVVKTEIASRPFAFPEFEWDFGLPRVQR
jgi:hypothetical protein